MGTPASPLILPDYYSEENWNYFVSCLPDDQRSKAPCYSDAAKSLGDTEAAFRQQGTFTIRMKVDAREWERWVHANGEVMSRETVGHFAMQKYVDQINERKSDAN